MRQIVAMHGWSRDSRDWKAWQIKFEQRGWSWISGERGYGSLLPVQPQWNSDSRDETVANRRVIIGYSLGPHLIDDKVLGQATDVVLLASFGRFVPQGTAGRALHSDLRAMEALIGTTREDTMIKKFLKRAAKPLPITPLLPEVEQCRLSDEGRQRLRQDLRSLREIENPPVGLPTTARVLVIEGAEDAIVAPIARQELLSRLREQLSEPPEHWLLPGIGHALILPELVDHVLCWLDRSITS